MRRMIPTNQVELIENLSKGLLPVTIYTEGVHLQSPGDDDIVIFNDAGDLTIENSPNLTITGNFFSNKVYSTGIYSHNGTNYIEMDDGTGQLNISGESVYLEASDGCIILNLPTTDPEVEGALWNDNGVLKISAGE